MRLLASVAIATLLATTATAAVPLGPLGNAVVPQSYRIDIKADPAQPQFSGHVDIAATVNQPGKTVYLHGLGLSVGKAEIRIGKARIPAKYAEVDASGVASLTTATPLPKGRVTISIDYTAGFRTGAEGLFRAQVGDDWYAWTQMEPLDARRMFPGFDEPGFKVPFTVSITAPAAMKAFANTPETAATPAGAGWVKHQFAPSKPLPTYLVAAGIGAFDVRETTIPANAVRSAPLAFRVIATKGQAGRMGITLSETPKIVGLLEDYFGIPYPYEKLDFLASPIQGGAVENAGLIIYGDSLILLNDNAPPNQVRGFGTVVAHELAHQWFGDLVTPAWWTDIWLNESFAEWMGNKIANRWRPDLGIAAGELDDAFEAMQTDSLGKGRPIRQVITRNDQVVSSFDGITYLKGAQTLSMFESFVGAANFRKGVQLHLNRYAFKNATADNFFASMAESVGNPALVPSLRTFTDQTGVPLLRMTEANGQVQVTQSRYTPLGIGTDRMLRQWQVPLCIGRAGSDAKSCTLLADASATVAAPAGSGALLPNVDGAGYFRFSLDKAGWQALIATAATLPGRDAMAMGDSLWAEYAAGRSDFATLVAAAEALAQNPERRAAMLLAGKLAELRSTTLSPAQVPAYRALMARIYAPRLAAIGYDVAALAKPGEAPGTVALREALVPLVTNEARDPALRAALKAAATQYLAGNKAAIAPTFRGTGLAVLVQDDGVPAQDMLLKALLASNDPLFRAQAARALGRAETPDAVAHARQLSSTPGLQSLEKVGILATLAGNPASRDATVRYVSDNFRMVVESFPGFARSNVIGFFAGYCSAADADRMDALIKPQLGIIGSGELELARMRDAILQCTAVKDAHAAEIAAVMGG
jgi:hypothetical protein